MYCKRKKNNLTYTEISHKLDISPQYLSTIVHQKNRISNKLFRNIEQLFQRYEAWGFLDDEGNL
ncbi:helix-turn-helix domain-containing protein [Clostridium kluyveri]|uniref:helix-turn-helix domain-containing protein n=1 Tax=Clostridium kluyveri TaxID=1534 RepID=UPI003A4C6FB1